MADELTVDTVIEVLTSGTVELSGRLVQASNATFFGHVRLEGTAVDCVYKPVRGERPLWDFPTGTLAGREVAAYLVSELAGWHVVPPTVLADGPFGPGMLQRWIDATDDDMVEIVPDGDIPAGWLHVLDAFDQDENAVSLVHVDQPALRRLALFDIVVNNADRKGGHVLPDGQDVPGPDQRVYGCDHGISFHVENKLRTVLWGWAGQPLDPDQLATLGALRVSLEAGEAREALLECISMVEYLALVRRVDDLIRTPTWPRPDEHWPSIPWPAF